MSGFQLDTDAFQLQRMMRQDAHEKAFEIMVKGQREYEDQKDKLIKEGERKLETEFQQLIDAQRIKHKIEVAQKTNAMRLEKMKRRNECMQNLRTAAAFRLQNEMKPENEQYQATLKNLIVQVSRNCLC